MIKAIKLIDYYFKFERASFRSNGGRGVDRLLVMGNRDALVKGRPFYRKSRYRESRVYFNWLYWYFNIEGISRPATGTSPLVLSWVLFWIRCTRLQYEKLFLSTKWIVVYFLNLLIAAALSILCKIWLFQNPLIYLSVVLATELHHIWILH